MISGYLGPSDAVDRAMCRFTTAYADQTENDHQALVEAVASGRLAAEPGIRLQVDPTDSAAADRMTEWTKPSLTVTGSGIVNGYRSALPIALVTRLSISDNQCQSDRIVALRSPCGTTPDAAAVASVPVMCR